MDNNNEIFVSIALGGESVTGGTHYTDKSLFGSMGDSARARPLGAFGV
ncbi:MAG: hypothetical protein FWC23_09815 [Chitinispirillia bacterium]|nr:hypothetical protein [Chitinispirillia bacterium]MCL2269465.1 hypothetical protein [Chitinispirillia bacterium]